MLTFKSFLKIMESANEKQRRFTAKTPDTCATVLYSIVYSSHLAKLITYGYNLNGFPGCRETLGSVRSVAYQMYLHSVTC